MTIGGMGGSRPTDRRPAGADQRHSPENCVMAEGLPPTTEEFRAALVRYVNENPQKVSTFAKQAARKLAEMEREGATLGPILALEEKLQSAGLPAGASRWLAHRCLNYFVPRLAEEWRAARQMASLFRKLSPSSSDLVISRIATKVIAIGMFEVLVGTRHPELLGFDRVLEAAARRDPKACEKVRQKLAAICTALPDPRGRHRNEDHHVYWVIATLLERGYTYDAYAEDFTDAATRTTRRLTGNDKFSPTRVRRTKPLSSR
jgi:hypothetical protein